MLLTATLLVSPLGHSRVHTAPHPEAIGVALRGRWRLAFGVAGGVVAVAVGSSTAGLSNPSKQSVVTCNARAKPMSVLVEISCTPPISIRLMVFCGTP